MSTILGFLSAWLARFGFGPTPAPVPVPPPVPPPALPTPEQVRAAHNTVRAMNARPPFTGNAACETAAQRHADHMAALETMAHSGIGDGDLARRLGWVGYGYSAAGENIEAGPTDLGAAMEAWMNSPPHRANILGDFREAGFGVARGDDGRAYFCSVFANPA